MYKLLRFFLVFSIFYLNCQSPKSGNYFEKIGSLNLNYIIKGSGPIMIVGHPNSGKIGYELSLQSLERYFTMVYYDPRGTGKSEEPKDLYEYNSEFLVEEIELLRQKLQQDKIWIFGHSDQSAIALEYAVKHPKQTEGLILTGTSLIGTQEESISRRKLAEAERAKESEWFTQVLKDWDYMIEHQTTHNLERQDISFVPLKWWCYNEESSQKVIPIVEKINQAGRRKPINGKNWIESPEQRAEYLHLQDSFPQIKTKILILNGKFDTNNPPKFANELHKTLPNSKLVLIDKAGHFPWIENKEESFLAIENWLNSISF